VLSWIQTHPALQARRLMPLVVVLAFMGAAAAMGVVVASGNLVLIGLAAGAILGVLLLNHLTVVVWMILIGTLLVSGPVVLQFPQLIRLQWLFSILGFFLIGGAILVAGIDRTPGRARMPAFIWLAVLFMVYSLSLLALSKGDGGEWAGAIKRTFQYWGLMFALAVVPFTAQTVRRWLGFLLILSLLQLPLALYQRAVLVPMRHNMPNGVVPVDIVAGTFEASMTGAGNNGVMVFFLIVVFATLLAAFRDNLLRPSVLMLLVAVVMAPLALGETKIVVVLLPLALLAVMADLVRKRPILFAMGSVITAFLMAGLLYVYVALQPTDSRVGVSFEQRLEENIEYNFGTAGYFAGASLNRSNVVPFWWSRTGTDDIRGTLFGYGMGSSFGLPGGDRTGHMDRKYPGYQIGLTGISMLLWDVGLIGFALYMSVLAGAFLKARELAARAPPGWDRALCRGLAASSLMLMPMILYSDVLLMAASMQVIMFFTLGLIAWRARYPMIPATHARR
jgi:hypothetical protein